MNWLKLIFICSISGHRPDSQYPGDINPNCARCGFRLRRGKDGKWHWQWSISGGEMN